VLALGVELRCGVDIDADRGVDELLADGFERVVVATGLPRGRVLPLEGAGLPGIVDGLTLLRRLARDEPVELGRRVAVIGGGDTAVDVAAAARRLGPDGRLVTLAEGGVPVDRVPVDREVTLVFRRRQLAARAHAEQARGATLDGVGSLGRVVPLEIIGRGRVEGLRLARVATYHDAAGRYRPRPLPGSEWRVEVDTVIAAIGRVPDGTWGGGPLLIEDAGTVIHAVAAGQRAAARVDRELTGGGEARQPITVRPASCAVTHPRPAPGRRASAPEVRGPERLLLRTLESELSPGDAAREGARCLDCRITVESRAGTSAERCALCGRCVEGCPMSALWLEPVEMGTALRYDPGRCLRCGLCVERCPAGCLRTTALYPETAGGHG
jgi:ferredoxin